MQASRSGALQENHHQILIFRPHAGEWLDQAGGLFAVPGGYRTKQHVACLTLAGHTIDREMVESTIALARIEWVHYPIV